MANQSGRMIDIDSLSEDIKICDINQSMLDVGKKRAFNKGIHEGRFFHFFSIYKNLKSELNKD